MNIGGLYYKDKNSIYYYSKVVFSKTQSADLINFNILSDFYTKYKNNVYFDGKQVIGADPETFGDICRDGWTRNKSNVYSNGKIISGTDPSIYSCGAQRLIY